MYLQSTHAAVCTLRWRYPTYASFARPALSAGAREKPDHVPPPIVKAREYGVGHTRSGPDGTLFKVVPGSTPNSFEWALAFIPYVGQRVLAHYGKDNDELWWPGEVITTHRSGHADIKYDDGDLEHKKSYSRLAPPV